MKNWKILALVGILFLIGVGLFVSNNKTSVTGENITNPSPTVTSVNDTSGGEQVTMEGTIICLPHKDTSGPVTLECAFGLRTEDANYGLKTEEIQQDGVLIYDVGDRVEVSGSLVSVEDLDEDDRLRIYDIEGVINVSSIELLD